VGGGSWERSFGGYNLCLQQALSVVPTEQVEVSSGRGRGGGGRHG